MEAWCDSGTISKTDIEEYKYGLELLISTTTNIVCLILISAVLGKQRFLLPYLLSFIPVRLFAGGYHARTHWGCVTFTAFLYLLALLCVHILPTRFAVWASYIIALYSLTVMLALAPVAAVNKPLSRGEYKIFRRMSLIISTSILAITLAVNLLEMQISKDVLLAFLYGEGAAAVSMIVQRIVVKNWVSK